MSRLLKTARRSINSRLLSWMLSSRFSEEEVQIHNAKHVAIYPKLGIAYNRIKKNANSTTVALLYKLEHGKVLHDRGAKLGSDHLEKTSLSLLRKAPDFHYLLIVRNPYSRVLSAFLNKFSKPAYRDAFGELTLDQAGFSTFADWLAEEGLNKDLHWAPQKNMMLLPADKYDTILKFEEFPGSLVDFLQSQNIDLSADAPEILETVNADTRSRASSKLQQYYTPDTAACVAELFSNDFAELGYSKRFDDAL